MTAHLPGRVTQDPIIRKLEADPSSVSPGAISEPIERMEAEHDEAGDGLASLRRLTSGYAAPEDACGSYRAMLGGLEQLERDMHQHVHKENNILFPRAMARANGR